MSQKVRKTLIMIVMAALIICLMAASLTYTFTYGRYAGGKFDEESPYDDLIEFVGAREYTVRSPEELIQAIKDGYSNIVIAEDAEEPFVITEGVTDVEANLVLNLNGKVVVRNSRNPMLDVQTNVSVVLVYDSKQTGAFYNPVGSSLMASGGSLTVGSGGYESGPRAEEYENGTAAGTLGDTANATLFARSNETNNAVSGPTKLDRSKYVSDYSLVSGVSLPTITPKTTQENGRTSVRGNVYLSSNHSDWLPADTFLLYTIEKDCFVGDGTSSGGVTFESDKLYVDAESEKVDDVTTVTASEFTTPLCNVASCDFYYYYPIDKEGNPIDTAGTADSPQDYAVIYGYWDVMALARDDGGAAKALTGNGLIWPYAAVRMVEGEGFARGGTFSNHFDVAKSYGIYAEGGRLSVSQNTTVDTTFTTGGEGVCIRVQSATGETTTTGEATTTGGSLTISGGTFSSEIGNTIEMSGGKMTVTKGTFTKDASAADTASTDNGSAIDIQGGTLTMEGSDAKSFTITGSHVNGVRVEGADDTTATATIKNATFNFNEGEGSNSVAGVRSFGGELVITGSTFNISSVDEEDINGEGIKIEQAAGLSTEGGTVEATDCKFYFAQNVASADTTASAGISSLGGTVTAENCEFTIPGNGNYGIYSQITVTGDDQDDQYDTTATNCTFTLTGNSNHGIYAAGGKTLASGGTITMIGSGSDREDNFGIHSTNGITRATGCTITMTGEYVVGVYTTGGRALIEGGSIKVDFAKDKNNKLLTSTAVSTEGGEIYLAGELAIESASLGVTVRGNTNMSGSLEIASDTITTGDGTTYPDITPGNVAIKTPNATGIYVNNGNLTNKGTVTVTSSVGTTDGADNGWKWVNAEGKPLDSFNKYNGVYVQGGSLDSKGTLNVTFTGVQNDAYGSGANSNLNANTAYRDFQIKSYAVRVEGTDETTVMITSGKITNDVGGGVLVNGGTVTLGKKETTNDDTTYSGLTVQTTGTVSYSTSMDPDGGNWNYFLPQTGGPAVKVAQSGSVSSTLTVYGGTYTAQQGDGIVTVGGTSYIHNGTFIGRDYKANSGDRAGPGASYSFKVYGGTANVYGGTFGGLEDGSYINSSGAFVMGTANSMGTANIYGGTFVVSKDNTGGQAGFSVYEYGNVVVAPKGGENGTGTDVTMTGLAAGLVIEGNTSNTVSVEIKGGTFSSTRDNGHSDGIWYSNSNATLKISGGTFTGAARSGLWFEVTPEIHDEGEIEGHGSHYSTNVKITGGGFKGDAYAIYANSEGWRPNRPSYAIGVNYIIVPGSLLRTDEWDSANAPGGTSVGYGEWDPAYWNDALEDTIINCKKIAVGQYYIETWWQQN